MNEYERISIHGEELWLLPERAIFLPGRSLLLLADLHLGKAGHFRKNGIPVPNQYKDLKILAQLIDSLVPGRVIFLGDLFHSEYNLEWEQFGNLLENKACQFELVMGNHDILDLGKYGQFGLKVHPADLLEGPFILTHIPKLSEEIQPDKYVLCGHLHPGIKLRGGGRQTLRLPCFHFGGNMGILPAFGGFTGLHILTPKTGDRVFVVGENEVFQVAG